jgi:membrane associated rhomboid family serine protease
MSAVIAGPDAQGQPNGAAMAAMLAAAIGSAAFGVLVLLGATGVYSAPVLYAPAGGLSTRSTLAVVAWLIAWFVLHRGWKDRTVSVSRVGAWTFSLVVASIAATFPPLWELLK